MSLPRSPPMKSTFMTPFHLVCMTLVMDLTCLLRLTQGG